MISMKKMGALVLSGVLATSMAFGLTSCSGGSGEKTIAVVAKGESHAFWQSVKAGAEAAGKEKGYKILATEIKGSVELKNIKKSDKQVLILGNEAHGVNEKILNLADERIRIDINEIESLNVAICGAIMMHYLR